MELKAISNSQPSFNGYLSKNLVNYVCTAVKREISNEVKTASKASKPVDVAKLKQISSTKKNIIENFVDYLSKLHKDTFIDLEYGFLNIKNPINKFTKINIYSNYISNKSEIIPDKAKISLPIYRRSFSTLETANNYDLNSLKIISELLPKISYKDIDKLFLKDANENLKRIALNTTGFLKKIIIRNYAKIIDKYASEIGVENTAKIRVEEYFKYAKDKRNIVKENIKIQNQLEKDNEKIAKEILKS